MSSHNPHLCHATKTPTLQKFGKLPREIQFEIWKLAASFSPSVVLPDDIFCNLLLSHRPILPSFFSQTSWTGLQQRNPFCRWIGWSNTNRIIRPQFFAVLDKATIRTQLLGTCRLSRQVVLECWKKDIYAIEMSSPYWRITDDPGRVYSDSGNIVIPLKVLEDVKKNLIDLLDCLIE